MRLSVGRDEALTMKRLHLTSALERVNKELWVVLSLFAIALLLNQVIAAQRMVLSFYVLPTIASAYFYGRRHGTLTAFASVLARRRPADLPQLGDTAPDTAQSR